MKLQSFSFSVPQDIRFGPGVLQELPEILAQQSHKKVLLISDHGLEKAGAVGSVVQRLGSSGISCSVFLDVIPNPTVEVVEQAKEAFVSSGAAAIVALGGGSPMDVAKAVGVVANYGGSITQYEGAHKVPGKITPLYAIPTTAGTGSEATAFSVITDTARNYKLTVFSYELLPHHVFLDPELIMTLPFSVAASTGVDAMIHALEAYISRSSTPFSDCMAEKALELIGGNIRRFVACRQDAEAAGAMLLGSLFAGIAFSWARLGNVHAMSHPVSAYFHVAHGVANSVLLPTVLRYNALADHGKYEKICRYIAAQPSSAPFTTDMLIDEVCRMLHDFHIPTHLSEVGVQEELIGAMAKDAMASGNIAANPRQSTLQDIEMLYHQAM